MRFLLRIKDVDQALARLPTIVQTDSAKHRIRGLGLLFYLAQASACKWVKVGFPGIVVCACTFYNRDQGGHGGRIVMSRSLKTIFYTALSLITCGALAAGSVWRRIKR
ncbi:MAG: hypothetical protein CM15mP74_20400 [Halieaceae bacterium]|nr:MAG: hypothetical protein CM15mP74_20400 [Halieaceae bacterium]